MRFEYHQRKAAKNLRDHKISFDEAETTFFDLAALSFPDESHSEPGDERFINLGMSTKRRLLFVYIMKTTESSESSAPGPLLRPKEPSMKKTSKTDPLAPRPNLDTSKAVRGKYANLLAKGSNVVLLDDDLLDSFPDSPSVNRALRAFLAINDQMQSASPIRRRRRLPSSLEENFDPRVGISAKISNRRAA